MQIRFFDQYRCVFGVNCGGEMKLDETTSVMAFFFVFFFAWNLVDATSKHFCPAKNNIFVAIY